MRPIVVPLGSGLLSPWGHMNFLATLKPHCNFTACLHACVCVCAWVYVRAYVRSCLSVYIHLNMVMATTLVYVVVVVNVIRLTPRQHDE